MQAQETAAKIINSLGFNVIRTECHEIGLSYQVYEVTTIEKSFIIRFSTDFFLFNSYINWLNILNDCGISSPKILYRGDYYIVYEKLPGKPLNKVNEISRFGEQMLDIHKKLTIIGSKDTFGLAEYFEEKLFDCWEDFLLAKMSVLNIKVHDIVRKRIERLKPVIYAKPFLLLEHEQILVSNKSLTIIGVDKMGFGDIAMLSGKLMAQAKIHNLKYEPVLQLNETFGISMETCRTYASLEMFGNEDLIFDL